MHVGIMQLKCIETVFLFYFDQKHGDKWMALIHNHLSPHEFAKYVRFEIKFFTWMHFFRSKWQFLQ